MIENRHLVLQVVHQALPRVCQDLHHSLTLTIFELIEVAHDHLINTHRNIAIQDLDPILVLAILSEAGRGQGNGI